MSMKVKFQIEIQIWLKRKLNSELVEYKFD